MDGRGIQSHDLGGDSNDRAPDEVYFSDESSHRHNMPGIEHKFARPRSRGVENHDVGIRVRIEGARITGTGQEFA